MMKPLRIPLHVVFYHDGDGWIAHCLEFDLAGDGPAKEKALTILANYARPGCENAIIPHVAGCQSIGIYTYAESRSAAPRAIIGLNDLSARQAVRRLGKDLMTVSVPFNLYQEMEANVPGSFLECQTWKSLQDGPQQ